MQVTKALIAAMALAAAGCGQPKSRPSPAVATINGQPITAAELDKQVGSELQQLDDQYHKQVYQTKRQALEGMIQKRVFEAKAKEAGAASPEELIQKEIASKIPDPTDAEVQSLYDRAVASGQQLPPIEQVKPDIIRFIKQQKMQGELMAYYEKLKKDQKVEVTLPPYLPAKKDVEAKGPTKGPSDAPITIVEFSDFECPYCIQAEKTVADLLAAYPGKIRLVYRDYPLPMHPLAPKAAEASQCAEAQGKYWQMHDALFGAKGKLEVAALKKYAREVGLDGGKFDTCLDSGEKDKVVAEHKKAGDAAGVNSTPAFFVNGRLLLGALPLEEFKAVVDAELTAIAKK